jgi:hypothetical protein
MSAIVYGADEALPLEAMQLRFALVQVMAVPTAEKSNATVSVLVPTIG